jgi:hypothetical protein
LKQSNQKPSDAPPKLSQLYATTDRFLKEKSFLQLEKVEEKTDKK